MSNYLTIIYRYVCLHKIFSLLHVVLIMYTICTYISQSYARQHTTILYITSRYQFRRYAYIILLYKINKLCMSGCKQEIQSQIKAHLNSENLFISPYAQRIYHSIVLYICKEQFYWIFHRTNFIYGHSDRTERTRKFRGTDNVHGKRRPGTVRVLVLQRSNTKWYVSYIITTAQIFKFVLIEML